MEELTEDDRRLLAHACRATAIGQPPRRLCDLTRALGDVEGRRAHERDVRDRERLRELARELEGEG